MDLKTCAVLLICLAGLSNLAARGAEPGVFVYVADPLTAPVPRFHSIESGLPAGLSAQELLQEVDPQAHSIWTFGWFTYGASNSRSIGVGLRKDSKSQPTDAGRSDGELYVDLDRNKKFSSTERVPYDPVTTRWTTKVGAEFLTELNDYFHLDRSIWIRRSQREEFLEAATRGVMEGNIMLEGTTTSAVRVDRDANGCWFDQDDRILIDVNGDGGVDPIGERVPCQSVWQIKGKRYAIQSDQIGERLDLVELKGTGNLVPVISLTTPEAVITEVTGALVSRSGVRVSIRELGETTQCPIGEYRIESLTLSITHAGKSYWHRFSSMNTAAHPIAVDTDQTVNIELLGAVTLTSDQMISRQRDVTYQIITPLLQTATGLYLSGSTSGPGQTGLENRLTVRSFLGEEVYDINSTGFS